MKRELLSNSLHRSVLAAFLVVVASAADDLQQQTTGRWLSRRDFVFDTTSSSNSGNGKHNMAPKTEGTELEFGQQRDIQVVHRKNTGRGNKKEVKRKRRLKVDTNHHHNNNEEHRYDESRNHHNEKHKDNGHHSQYIEHDEQHHQDRYKNHKHNLEKDGKQEHVQPYDNNRIDEINIDAELMGHILQRKSAAKSMHYHASKKPTRKPTNKASV